MKREGLASTGEEGDPPASLEGVGGKRREGGRAQCGLQGETDGGTGLRGECEQKAGSGQACPEGKHCCGTAAPAPWRPGRGGGRLAGRLARI